MSTFLTALGLALAAWVVLSLLAGLAWAVLVTVATRRVRQLVEAERRARVLGHIENYLGDDGGTR